MTTLSRLSFQTQLTWLRSRLSEKRSCLGVPSACTSSRLGAFRLDCVRLRIVLHNLDVSSLSEPDTWQLDPGLLFDNWCNLHMLFGPRPVN